MIIPESQAKQFAKKVFISSKQNTLENLKASIDSKLVVFNREKDKLDFLKVLISETKKDVAKHEETCTNENCKYDKERCLGVFLMEQEIDTINEYFTFEPKNEDKFSVEEETSLHNKLNEIIEKLNKQELGQEILFDEIESLKNHFNLGKKTWFQLLKGKLLEVTGEKIIEATVATEVLKELSEGYTELFKWIK